MLAEIVMATLFLMFSNGWTLTFDKIDWNNNLEIYIPLGAIIVAVHLILAALTSIDMDAHHKYHDFSGVQGIVLLVLRLCLFAYFMYLYF
jgi:hypothetical protein